MIHDDVIYYRHPSQAQPDWGGRAGFAGEGADDWASTGGGMIMLLVIIVVIDGSHNIIEKNN